VLVEARNVEFTLVAIDDTTPNMQTGIYTDLNIYKSLLSNLIFSFSFLAEIRRKNKHVSYVLGFLF
jgi:hypothetical protein